MNDNNTTQFIRSSLISNTLLIWLDFGHIDLNESSKYTIDQVQHMIHSFQTFTNIEEYIDFITDVKNESIFLILPCSIDEEVVLTIKDIPQINLIYVVCSHSKKHTQWIKSYRQVKEIDTGIETISDILKCDIERLETYLTSISIVSDTNPSNFEELEPSFMYSRLLKETILSIDHDEDDKKKFIDFCSLYYANDEVRLRALIVSLANYNANLSIPLYTREFFFYSTLNKALRTQNTTIIIQMGLFIKDLHQQIEKLHIEAPQTETITVYRGQGLYEKDFEKLKRSKGRLLSFNNFLSTSTDNAVSLAFAESASADRKTRLIGILFQMTIHPSKSSTPFASLKNASCFDQEEEILFSMHTVFRIGEMEEINDRLWKVHLVLTDDDDQELRNLTEYIRSEIKAESGWQTMGSLMTKMGEFDKAIEIYRTLTETMLDRDDEQTVRSRITNYNNIALAYNGKGDYSSALSNYKKVLNIYEESFPENHPSIAITYNNMAAVYRSIDNYQKALEFFNKSIEIQEKTALSNNQVLGVTYNNIGTVYRQIGDYPNAILYMEKALQILKECLPNNHPDLAATYNNLAEIHFLMGNNSTATSDFENAFEIW